ncbi:MAG TPA: cupin domain-containing protein [Flavitalea sp.]|nr:cupin domain-containing protein [Flavitalea sp.]
MKYRISIQSLLKMMMIGLSLVSCSNNKTGANASNKTRDNNSIASVDQTKEIISIFNLVKENKIIPDSIIRALNAQHHQLKVLERRTVPGPFEAPKMKYYTDYIAKVENLPVINPGPGEYVHVMEGQRNGYNNLTIGITETFPNGAPPMHSHEGEESHVLLEGEVIYALADTLFTLKGPYIVNIPAGVPHAFKNLGKKTANLVVIFPTNIWKYDVLDFFPFKSDSTKSVSGFTKFKNSLAKK